MNWPSSSTNYSIAASPFCAARKKASRSCDLVGEFLASCDKYNITRGLYYTISNSHCKTVPSGGAPGNTSCDTMLRSAFTELATKYGASLRLRLLGSNLGPLWILFWRFKAPVTRRANRTVLVRPRKRAVRRPGG
jgi:hypothetical protein